MIKLCLDSNCIISLELKEASAQSIERLIQAADAGKVAISILGISASERQLGGGQLRNIGEFIARLERIGASRLEILKPIGVREVTFWDWCIFASDQDSQLLAELHTQMSPNIRHSWPDYAAEQPVDPHDRSTRAHRKWINAHCDAQVAWACVHYQQDALITMNTHDFQKNASKLFALGLKRVATPEVALTLI